MNFLQKHKYVISILVILCLSLIVITIYQNNTTEHYRNKSNNIPTIVNYFSGTCPHCHAFRPIWDKFKNTISNKNIKVVDIQCDAEENFDVCRKRNIMGYPTVMLYTDNKNIEFEDTRSVDNLENFCQKYIKDL
jgi:thiol-disulfide isomerase/thioredoxin